MKEIIFYYDVICPYANLASKLIGDLAKRNQAKLLWRPVVLGGIYKSTKHKDANLPDNKMLKTYSDVKRNILAKDIAMLYSRYNIPISTFKVPDIRTLNAMRLIASTPDESSELRVKLTHSLFDAIWREQKDVSNMDILQGIADSVNWNVDVRRFVEDKNNPCRQILMDNTNEAVQRGAFGVPSMWVNDKLYFGNDRLFFVEHELGNKEALPHRLLNRPMEGIKKRKLTFYMDFSSPWTYLGFKQLPALVASMEEAGVEVDVEYVPFILGMLFKTIGAPMVPIQAMGDNKRNYHIRDLNDWMDYLKLELNFSTHFPLRTISALRMAIVNPEYKMMEAIFDAGMRDNKNLSDDKVLEEVLTSAGYDFQILYRHSNEQSTRTQLRENLQRALDAGICGVPSFQVDDGPVVFGQDRMNVVEDMLLGWQFNLDSFLSPNSKL